MFNLLRYSQLIALAVPIAVVVALTYLYRGLVFDSMVEGETHANVALTRTFANAIWPAHAAFVRRAGALERPALASRAEIGVLDGDLRRLASGLDIVKVKIYDLHGLTVYSTDPRQIGQSAAGNPGFRRARDGYPVSNLTYRERMDSWEGEIAQRHILATYVPVHVHEAAPVEAVLEIYSDVTRLVEANQRSEWKVLAAVLGAMALLYAVVQLMLARYRRLLEEKERERAAQEERIRHQAYHDPLTGLPNRASFTEHLEEAMRRAKRAGWPLALLFLDLDLFKRVNDCLGHDAGDRLLRVAAERIRRAVREADMLFRMGGDEFTVLLEDVRGPEEAAMVATRVLETIAEPLQLQHHEIAVTSSVGIALYPRDDVVGERLVKAADTAMYRAKELGRNRYAFFAREMNERVETQMMVEAALRRALKNEEFVLYFQPRVSAATGRATGAEALLRWKHPEWGLVEPARFVPLLEETGLIVPVGAWVLAEACRAARAWQSAGLPPLRVSVNLSSRQFRSEALCDAVSEALRSSGLAPQLLELELTESLLIENVEHAMGVMGQLKAIGTVISIDDFGTGYSSLGYLKRFPIDSLKIDRSFVRDIATSPKDAAIVKAISALARSLGIGLIAEGVEEPWQVEFLRGRYCTELQGFFFSRPLPEEALVEALRRSYPLTLSRRAAVGDEQPVH
ncbi:MAG TPA: EAL domain-containing protein [Burkholderiales bacterium]|nr:EAL domain-containing protein [Burkholderiales bacterium]